MTRRRRAPQRLCNVWSRRAVVGEGFSRVGVACASSLNMGNPNWTHCLTSGVTNSSRRLLQVRQIFRRKFLASVNHWMRTVHRHIAELAARMVATRRVQSDSNILSPSRPNPPVIINYPSCTCPLGGWLKPWVAIHCKLALQFAILFWDVDCVRIAGHW